MIEWALVISLFGNVIALFQWKQATDNAEDSLRNEIMNSALSAKEASYTVRVGCIYFIEQFGQGLEKERIDSLNRAVEDLGTHISNIENLYSLASDKRQTSSKALKGMRKNISVILSNAKDMSSLLAEARKHHESV
jgi:hypothetical protein